MEHLSKEEQQLFWEIIEDKIDTIGDLFPNKLINYDLYKTEKIN